MAETMVETLEERAAAHRVLGDPHRLSLVECVADSDRTPGQLADLTGMSTNLLAFHLRSLEEAGLIERRRSEGDARRRYVTLRWDRLPPILTGEPIRMVPDILFVCTHNSARSQFAEGLWRSQGGSRTWSAGTDPSDRVHPHAVSAAAQYGVDLSNHEPKGFDAVPDPVDLVISVCDKAVESGLPSGERIHWSIPDPKDKGPEAFQSAFADISHRISRLHNRIVDE